MTYVLTILQFIVSFSLLNVWLVRFSKDTPYRGGLAKNLKEEFKTYGLPDWVMYLVGFLKICSAITLILGFWIPSIIAPAALLVVFLMSGALLMHFKVKDPIMKSVPAALMLVMSMTIFLNSNNML